MVPDFATVPRGSFGADLTPKRGLTMPFLQSVTSAWNSCFPEPSDILDKSSLKKPPATSSNAAENPGSPPQCFQEKRTCWTAAVIQS